MMRNAMVTWDLFANFQHDSCNMYLILVDTEYRNTEIENIRFARYY